MACRELYFWDTIKVFYSHQMFDVFELGATTSIAVSKKKKRAIRSAFVLIFLNVVQNFLDRTIRDIGISWWKMAEHCRAVDALPIESVVRELVENTP